MLMGFNKFSFFIFSTASTFLSVKPPGGGGSGRDTERSEITCFTPGRAHPVAGVPGDQL